MDRITIRGQDFWSKSIMDGNCFISNSLPCDELTVDTLSARIDGSGPSGTRFVPLGSSGLLTAQNEAFFVRPYVRVLVHDLSLYTYGEAVEYYHDGALVGKFYMEKSRRVGKYIYEITCTSAVGLLDGSTHYGGIYTGQTVSSVLADIISGTVPYTLDLELSTIQVYGWLPVATRRENLQQLLFATGISVRKATDGTLRFTVLTDETATAIGDERIYLGGDVDHKTQSTAAEVTEHAYIAYATDEGVTLYEGEVPAETMITPGGVSTTGVLVLFDGPMYDIVAANVAIIEHGVNYAVLGASPSAKLTGKKYTHTTRVIRSGLPQSSGDNVVRVTNATLVSLANAENVANRVYAYYGKTTAITSDIVVGSERPGDYVSFRDPFDDARTGFVQSMDISISNVLRASTSFASGYKPAGVGNFYTQSALLTAAGTWTVPANTYKIRVSLVGGGNGGCSGGNGKQGEGSAFDTTMKNGGAGGAGGYATDGGKILVVTIPVTPGQVFSFSPGAGGSGGLPGAEPIAGAAGGDTLFGDYSSASGKPSYNGFADIFGKGVFGLPSAAGYGGGNGSGKSGVGNPVVVDGVTYTAGESGANESNRHGSAQGGAGGGAGYGSNGNAGGSGDVYFQPAVNPPPTGWWYAQGGNGGKGGDGQNGTNASSYGSAGGAGHGGGGGGAGGGASGGDDGSFGGSGGAGGKGGTGGNGGAGCALIYY